MDGERWNIHIYLDFDADDMRVLSLVEHDGKVRKSLLRMAENVHVSGGNKRLLIPIEEPYELGSVYPSAARISTTMELWGNRRAIPNEGCPLPSFYFGAEPQSRSDGNRDYRERVYNMYNRLRAKYLIRNTKRYFLNSSYSADHQVDARKIVPLLLARVVKDVCTSVAMQINRESRTSRPGPVGANTTTEGFQGKAQTPVRLNVYPYINWCDESPQLREFWTDCTRRSVLALQDGDYSEETPPTGQGMMFSFKESGRNVTVRLWDAEFPVHNLSCIKLYNQLWCCPLAGMEDASMAGTPPNMSRVSDSRSVSSVGSGGGRAKRDGKSAKSVSPPGHILVDMRETEVRVTCFLAEPATASIAPSAKAFSSTISLGSGEGSSGGIRWDGYHVVQLSPVRIADGGLDGQAAKQLTTLLVGGVNEGGYEFPLLTRLYANARISLDFRKAVLKLAAALGPDEKGKEAVMFAYDSFMSSEDMPVAECDLQETVEILGSVLGGNGLADLMKKAGPLGLGDLSMAQSFVTVEELESRINKLQDDLESTWQKNGFTGDLRMPGAPYQVRIGQDSLAKGITNTKTLSPPQRARSYDATKQRLEMHALAYHSMILEPALRRLTEGLSNQLAGSTARETSGEEAASRSWASTASGFSGVTGVSDISRHGGSGRGRETPMGGKSENVAAALRRAPRVNVYWAGSMSEFFPLRYAVSETLLRALGALGALGAGEPADDERGCQVYSRSFRGSTAAGLWAMAYAPVWPSELEEWNGE